MRIALSALDISWEDIDANVLKIKGVLNALEGQDLIIFPELTTFGFSMNQDAIIEGAVKLKKFDEWVSSWHSKHNVNIIYGTPLIVGNEVYNSAIFYYNGQRIVHKKSKLFSFAGEDVCYTQSSNGLTLKNGFLLSICFELRFPELFIEERLGFKISVNIANWPESRINHYSSLIKARAIENQAFMICVNRSGFADGVDYKDGYLSIIDFAGEALSAERQLVVHGPIALYNIDLDEVYNFRNKFKFYD